MLGDFLHATNGHNDRPKRGGFDRFKVVQAPKKKKSKKVRFVECLKCTDVSGPIRMDILESGNQWLTSDCKRS